MELIEKKGEGLNQKIIVELDRRDGELIAEALDHAEHALNRLNDAQIGRGEAEPEGVHQPPHDYGMLANRVAGWLGIDYLHGLHLDDAIKAEEDRKEKQVTSVLAAAERFQADIEAEPAV